ncbi:MAG: polyphenol oxidase family protein [Nocardioides sp.]
MFAYQASNGTVDVAFTDRHGGVSGGPYASLNLGYGGADHRDTVQENLDLVAHALAARDDGTDPDRAFDLPPGTPLPVVVGMRQVHGSDVAVIDVRATLPIREQDPVADALVTAVPGVILMVRAADCVPILLADVARGVVGAVHSGRPGLVAGVVPSAVAALREQGARRLVAWVGPHVCGFCYEVPQDMRAAVVGVVPESFAETSWGTPSLDIGAGVLAQLRSAGVDDVVVTGRCTREDEDLFSYRRQGPRSGRLAGLVWVRP